MRATSRTEISEESGVKSKNFKFSGHLGGN